MSKLKVFSASLWNYHHHLHHKHYFLLACLLFTTHLEIPRRCSQHAVDESRLPCSCIPNEISGTLVEYTFVEDLLDKSDTPAPYQCNEKKKSTYIPCIAFQDIYINSPILTLTRSLTHIKYS